MGSDTVGDNSAARLLSLVERIERLDEEVIVLKGDIKDIFSEAKSAGFDVPALRVLLRMRKEDASKREEREMLVATYARALGMLSDLPLGKAALDRV